MIYLSLVILIIVYRQIFFLFRRRTRSAHTLALPARASEMEKASFAMHVSLPSPVIRSRVSQSIAKGSLGGLGLKRPQGFVSFVRFTAPIPLKEHDLVWVDSRNGNVEVIEREGIAIWRAAWVN